MAKTGEHLSQQSILLLHLTADGQATFKRVPHTLPELQRMVGGYLEPIRLAGTLASHSLLGLVNEDGQIKGMSPNPFSNTILADVYGSRQIVGDAIVVRAHGADFVSLTTENQKLLRLMLKQDGIEVPA